MNLLPPRFFSSRLPWGWGLSLWVGCTSSLAFAQNPSQVVGPDEISAGWKCIELILGNNTFRKNGGPAQYASFFRGTSFEPVIASLGRGSRIVDIGAGNAKFLREYLSDRWNADPDSMPEAVAVGWLAPDDDQYGQFLDSPASAHFKYLAGARDGRYFEDWSLAELGGKFQVGVDNIGAGGYSLDLNRLFEKYGQAIEEGGKLYLFPGEDRYWRIVDQNGNQVPKSEWLSAIQGFKLETITPFGAIELTRTSSDPVSSPLLEMTPDSIPMFSPPYRFYRWIRP